MYRQVIDAYFRGLERHSGDLSGLASVASFFVSRVDTAVDRQLDELARAKPELEGSLQDLHGKAAIANAKLAYAVFKETFQGARWESLRQRGAHVQRPLWASTGTKNPNYSDVLYVEELIGRDTVNTMPPATVEAFKDHGEVEATVEQDLDGARRSLRQLDELGIRMADVTHALLDEGVKLFAEAFDTLVAVIDAKRGALRDNIAGREQASLGELQKAVDARLAALAKTDSVRRMWRKDPSLWDGTEEIKERLGWLTITDKMLECTADLERFAAHVKDSGIKHALLCASAGVLPMNEVYAQAFGAAPGYPNLTTVAAERVDTLTSVDPDTLVILVGKSATSPLVVKGFEHIWKLLPKADHYVVATDEGTELAQLAKQRGFRRVFLNAQDVAGNFGALSYLALTSAAVIGVDVERILNRAEHVVQDSVPLIQPADNAGAWFAAILGEAAAAKRKIGVICSPAISNFGRWAAAIANGAGLPAEALQDLSSLGSDHLVVYVRLGSDLDAAVQTLQETGQPVVTFTLRDKFDLGQEFFRWQFATALGAAILGQNPFRGPVPSR